MGSSEMLVDGTYFTFPQHWHVEVFDEWPQYVKAAGILGIQGCDVVALDGEELWIIEMKDYTYEGANKPPDLHKTVGLKASGTMALLYALTRTSADSAAKEFAVRCLSTTRINLALHVEVKDGGMGAKKVSAVLPAVLHDLKKSQKALGLHKSFVTSTLAPSRNTPWTARRDPATRSLHADR